MVKLIGDKDLGRYIGFDQTENINLLLDRLSYGSKLVSVKSLNWGNTNIVYLINALSAKGEFFRAVIRSYKEAFDTDYIMKAEREYQILKYIHKTAMIPVPKPLILDNAGLIFKNPSIVIEYIEGNIDISPEEPTIWAQKIARSLVKIHRIPLDTSIINILSDANSKALWFLKDQNNIPEFVSKYPKGEKVWTALKNHVITIDFTPKSIVHFDFWSGQLLWSERNIAAILDWEEVGFGNPAIDVASCYMGMVIGGKHDAATEFLNVYSSETNGTIRNLNFWKLVVAVRPMLHPEGWIDLEPAKYRFNRYLETILQDISY